MSRRVDYLFAWGEDGLIRRKVVQCALSRVCGACGRPLNRPIAFVGNAAEVMRNEFHSPPLHAACADQVPRSTGPEHVVVLTAGFEFVRPATADLDQEPRFLPNSIIG